MTWPTTQNGKTVKRTMFLRCLNYILIDGRLVDFLKRLWTHYWMFLHLDKDETFRLFLVQLQTKDNVRLQAGTF
jgi:hypothetical protein